MESTRTEKKMRTDTEQVKVQVHLEEKPAKEIFMAAYAFDAHGSLVASAPVDKEGQAALTIPSKFLPQGRLFIASTPPKEQKELAVTIDELHRNGLFSPTSLRFFRPGRAYDRPTLDQCIVYENFGSAS
jgi:hypothetical protein